MVFAAKLIRHAEVIRHGTGGLVKESLSRRTAWSGRVQVLV